MSANQKCFQSRASYHILQICYLHSSNFIIFSIIHLSEIKPKVHSHLYFFNHLFSKRANFGRAGDGHILRALVLTGHTVKPSRILLDVTVQVSL